jgi:hypothetical protein
MRPSNVILSTNMSSFAGAQDDIFVLRMTWPNMFVSPMRGGP